jgi:thymidylate synthase
MQMSFNDVYYKIIRDLWYDGIEVTPRGMKSKEIIGYKFVLSDPKDNIVTLPGFETNVQYCEEELKWYYSGSNRIDFSPKIEKTWKQFSDDGLHVNSAYGFQIFGIHPDVKINQWKWVVDKFKEDPDTRQAVININLPSHKHSFTKDFPCTISLQMLIRDGKLHWITSIRSNDVFYGVRNDIFCFTSMQRRMAADVGCSLGDYIHFAGSMHLYEKHYDKAINLLKLSGDLK